jgi:hypothetical protein
MYPKETALVLSFITNEEQPARVAEDKEGNIFIREWFSDKPQPTEQDILDNLMPWAKSHYKTQIRKQAQELIFSKWPSWKQQNCSLGIYPDTVITECSDDIAAVIEASNTAEDAIDTATTIEDVEAVSAIWPEL